MTPPASWRPAGLPHSAFIVGPATCQCGALVWFGRANTRVQGITVVGEAKVWREWGRYAAHSCAFRLASRARAMDNDADEYSVPIAHTVQRPASRLYSEARGVDVHWSTAGE